MEIVSYLEALVVGRFSWLMYLYHVSQMICGVVVVGLGILICSWDASSFSVAARVYRAVSSLGWNRGLSPLCSFMCTDVTLGIWSCVCPDSVIRAYSILVLSLTPSPHRGPSVLRVCLRI
jgi:hypothetical protein